MKNNPFKLSILGIFIILGLWATAQEVKLKVDATSIAKIQPTMYGLFFEDINFAADGGLYAELIKNRSFEFANPKMGWIEPESPILSFNTDSGLSTIVKYAGYTTNHNYINITVNNPDRYTLINEGFRGMGIKAGATYELSVMAAQESGAIEQIHFQLMDEAGTVIGETSITPEGKSWKTYEMAFTATKTAEKAQLKISFQGKGSINLDMISLFPQDTWKGRKKGLRKDIVQLLDDIQPGFLRFPGGCIVEGRTLAKRYQWKKTVGPIEDRELLINRWNSEFDHRPTPDYYQSFGIGFFEYFQLAEDMGAAPLPILGCGMACQFNTGELVPMEDLGPYVQDALDLIEFANGSTDTPWGKVRSDMGHPDPFHMKHIGIGNEQWGPEYIKRYKVFEKAIKEKYPDMIIVSGSGPFPDGEYFEYGWEELKKLNTEIVDEHYYRPPSWFRENATRYDQYDRSGPKVFAGEYAAQSVGTTSPDNKNNWDCALSEAAFMTGLERNADLVTMTSYAPLMAHAEGWQWTPDLLWFNNLESYGTTNYYVQKLFANNAGTDLIRITEEGVPLTGQHELYASAVTDTRTKELILKLVNTADDTQEVSVAIDGIRLNSKGEAEVLTSASLNDENSFDAPKAVSPKTEDIKLSGGTLKMSLAKNSLTVVRLKTK